MKAVKARLTRGLPVEALVATCDNSGAKAVKIFSVYRHKTSKGQFQSACVGDLVLAAVKRGKPELRKTVVAAVIVRQRRPYRRADGTRIAFEDNAVVVLKDNESGTPKGTMIKGPVAKEAADRWPDIAKQASIIV